MGTFYAFEKLIPTLDLEEWIERYTATDRAMGTERPLSTRVLRFLPGANSCISATSQQQSVIQTELARGLQWLRTLQYFRSSVHFIIFPNFHISRN